MSLIATWRSLLSSRPIVVLLLTSLLLTVANEVPFIVYGAWLETTFSLSLSALGLASIVVGLAEASAELGTTLLTDRLGQRRSVLFGLLGLAASLLLLPWLSQNGLAPALAGVALMLFTFEFGIVSLLPMATELAPDARATLLSLNIMAMSLGRILGAGIGAWASGLIRQDSGSYDPAWLLGVGLCIAAGVCAATIPRRTHEGASGASLGDLGYGADPLYQAEG